MSAVLKYVLTEIEAADLSDAFWEVGLIQNLTTTSPNAPAIKVYWAAQANLGDKGFLSRISQWGDASLTWRCASHLPQELP